jgi:hypothetical protein
MYPGNCVFTASLQESGYTRQEFRQTQAHDQGQEDHQKLEQVHAVNSISSDGILLIAVTNGPE